MCKHCMTNISNFACQACLCVRPPRQTLLDKHFSIVTSKTFFACHKQKMFVKHMFVSWPPDEHVFVKQYLLSSPNVQACLTSKIRNTYEPSEGGGGGEEE